MSKSYLIAKDGETTKWIVRTPLLIKEEALQKLFPDLPSDESEREKFFKNHQEKIDKLFDTVACWFDEGDPLEEHEDPKGNATPNWNTAEIKLDDGDSYRYFCNPCPIDLNLLKDIAENDGSQMPSEFAERLKNLED